MSHIVVIANETVAGTGLIDHLKGGRRPASTSSRSFAPVNHPREGYVVYEDTRRAAAGRRLDRTWAACARPASAHGFVVEADPAEAVRDAIAQLEPRPTEIVVSTHPEERSGWLRRSVIERVEKVAEGLPVHHVVVDMSRRGGPKNVLVVANETVVGRPLLDRIRRRAEQGPGASCSSRRRATSRSSSRRRRAPAPARPLSCARRASRPTGRSPSRPLHGDGARRPRRARGRDHHLHLPGRALRLAATDLVGRVRSETGLPVEHVVTEPEAVGASPTAA